MIQYLIKTVLIIGATFIITMPAAGQNLIQIRYNAPLNDREAGIKKDLEANPAIDDIAAMINETFNLANQVIIIFGGEDGPLFDTDTNEILIPYYFIDEITDRFKKDNYSQTGVRVEDAAMDALMHTLFHEIGHALISMFSIPVLGKHEDAVDGLADLLLIEYFENGQEIVVSAADLFDLESRDTDPLEEADFWDEHSLDVQRYYTALCHVYGSAPDQYKELPGLLGFSDERADNCIEDYETLSDNWHRLLEPYMKKQPNRTP